MQELVSSSDKQRQALLTGIRFINDIRHWKCCYIFRQCYSERRFSMQSTTSIFFNKDGQVNPSKKLCSFLQKGNYQCYIHSQEIHDPLSTIVFTKWRGCVSGWWHRLDIMVFTECYKWPLRKWSARGGCFSAKCNQDNTHTHTLLIDTFLKSLIRSSSLSWSYKHTHTHTRSPSGNGGVVGVRRCSSAASPTAPLLP